MQLTPQQLAARWQVSEKTLARWRQLGTGPAYLRLGGSVRYPIEAISTFEQAGKMRRTNLAGLR